MSEARLTQAADGRWVLGGQLDFSSVPEVWPTLEQQLRQGRPVTLSLRDVERANSAGLVLLIEALDVARRVDCTLSLVDIPEELIHLARMSSCDDLIAESA